MSTIIRFTALSAFSLSLTACAPTDDATSLGTLEAPLDNFLAFYFDDYRRGLPGPSQLPQLASFVTPEFRGLFEAAQRGQDCYAKKNDYEGPPAIEGDLFSSLFEGGTSATYRLVSQERESATFDVEWTHDSPVAESPFSWKDQVLLVKVANGWLIADIVRLGTWDFATPGPVSGILRALAGECDP